MVPHLLWHGHPGQAGVRRNIAVLPRPSNLLRMPHYVYIMASGRNGTLYVGYTNDLIRRAHEHRTKAAPGFTARYSVSRLVHFEEFDNHVAAAQRERRLKKWRRDWKLELIEKGKPGWTDLFDTVVR